MRGREPLDVVRSRAPQAAGARRGAKATLGLDGGIAGNAAALQRLAGNRATRTVIQRGLDTDLQDARAAVDPAARTAVENHIIDRRSKSHGDMITIWKHVKARETGWTEKLRTHIFKGEESGKSVVGYHSKLDASSVAEGVGTKNPSNVGDGRPYKQNVRLRTDTANNHLKSHASTFFPDGWDAEKIRAAYLLSGSTGRVSQTDQGVIEINAGTAFPAGVNAKDPPRPQ